MGGSETDGGLFEFDQLSDSSDDGGDTDPPDESDRPDPPDDGAGSPMASRSESSAALGSADHASTSNEPTARTEGSGDDSAESSSGSDADDPPDPPDDGNDDSAFYDIDPVEESQQAFRFAEKRSRAAAETAYKRAADSWFGRQIKRYTSPQVRNRLDEVFSRRMLGSVLVGGAFSKIVETSIGVAFGDSSLWYPVMWAAVFAFSTVVFVWWDHLARRANEAAEKASETASEAAEKATETATEAAERATEAAAEATGETTPPAAKGRSAGVSLVSEKRSAESSATASAGGRRPTATNSRRRSAERRPNKRFAGESGEKLVELTDEQQEPVYEGGGFTNAGDAATEGSER